MFQSKKSKASSVPEELKKTVGVDYTAMHTSLSPDDYESTIDSKNSNANQNNGHARESVVSDEAKASPTRAYVDVNLDGLMRGSEPKREEQLPGDTAENREKTDRLMKMQEEIRRQEELLAREEIHVQEDRKIKEAAAVQAVQSEVTPVIQKEEKTAEIAERTISSYSYVSHEGQVVYSPVVGWLVCIEGANYGTDYRLHTDHNYVGSKEGDIVISGDNQISPKNHMRISFEPKKCKYYISNAEGLGYIYVNDTALNGPMELNNYDIISVGETELMFFGFCGEQFKWKKN